MKSQKEQEQIAQKLASLTQQKRKVLIKLLQKEGINPAKLPIIANRKSAQIPLSWGQERLWFLDQFEENSTTYNLLLGVTITGKLDINYLQKSLNTIIERHEVLRTNFQEIDGHAVQIITAEKTWPLIVENCQESEINKYIHQEQQKPFNLATDTLVRGNLLKISENKFILLITRHHIVWDGWSTGIFLQELSTIYQSYIQGKNPDLTPLTIQYADFSQWQREWLTEEILGEQIKYWQENLKNAPSLLQLPTDKPRPSIMTFNGKSQQLIINQEITEKLQLLSRETGTTLFMTLLAVFSTLLYRYSHQEDILIGSPIANRNRAEIEPLIGFFVNSLVLRTSFTENLSFAELLQQIKQTTLSAYEHQDVPFEQIVDAVKVERSLSHSPLFQVMFVLQNTPSETTELPDVTLTPLTLEKETTNFDLTLDIEPSEQGLVANWEYNSDLFEDATITRMLGHFENVLTSVLANPQQQINQINLLTVAERNQLLFEWNNTKVAYRQDKCIHQLFEEQVIKTPDAVAVVFENQQLTYQELNQKANQLAHYLQNLGVKPETLVAICVERSLEMVIGLLGILKAGGAYVPIDPNYPSDRIAYMLSDAAMPILLTQELLLTTLPKNQAQIICLDSHWEKIATQKDENLTTVSVKFDNLAYVIYTSGSTGKPKGAMNTHGGISNRLLWMQDAYKLTASDRILQKTPFSFDVSVWEFFWPLLFGATLVVAQPEGHKDSAYLVNLIKQAEITTLHFVPSMLQVFLQESGVETCKSIKRVICSGEALPYELQERFFTKLNQLNCELHNLYGPTEAAIDVTFWQCQPQLPQKIVPIGKPIANTQLYILDRYFQPVPVGVPGELYIGGVGVCRGYLNRTELTNEKFISNLFGTGKLYKTGDLTRYLADGNIEYLGRIDNQVKLRGFRIELGEIESALDSYPGIQQTVVIVRQDIPGNQRLVAYLATEDKSLNIEKLKDSLKKQLPEFMIPSAFIILENLPLSPNGKVDRKALPAPDLDLSKSKEFVPPQTPNQEIIADIFRTVLNLKSVGIYDSFFDLGGHSLLATQVISRLRKVFSVEISLKELFAYATISELSDRITSIKQLATSLQNSIKTIAPVSRNGNLTLSFAQERLWFLDQLEGASSTYNIPGILKITGNLQINILEKSLQEIVNRHEVLRTNFQAINGQPAQVINSENTWQLKIEDWTNINLAEIKKAIQKEIETPFNLATDNLLRVITAQINKDEFLLIVTMHHIISDGWSLGIFIQELSTLYQNYLQGKSSPLPNLTIQYADFATWQKQWLTGETLDQEIKYWQEQLTAAPSLLQLPTDKPRPSIMTFNGKSHNLKINPEITKKLENLSKKTGTTLFMTLLAIFATLLYRYSHQEDILIGSPIANRNRSEIEPLIGCFVNTLVLRTKFTENINFRELLNQVKETTLEAYDHQDVPFEQIVEAIKPERSLSHSPLFQVLFVLQNAPMEKLELPGVNIEILPSHTSTAKFDLTLSMMEQDQELSCTWDYNSDLFDEKTITTMSNHFQKLITEIIVNSEQKINQIKILAEAEEKQLIEEYNNTKIKYPHQKCVHQLFTEQAEKTPDAIAIKFANQQLTYQELNQKANQLANYLQKLGVKPETLVGICIERSLEMVIALLGILKAGGAYVPIDPNYPTERIAYMLSDSNAELLLTQSSLLADFTEYQKTIVCLDQDWEKINQESTENIISQVKPDNLAYVIYTSGSTGKPKGVQIQHQGLVNFLNTMKKQPGIKRKDVFNAVTTICFDIAGLELYLPLIVGAKVVITSREIATDGMRLLQHIQDEKITIMQATPATWQMLITAGLNKETLQKNKINKNKIKMLCGGEALTTQLSNQLLETGGELWNLYGPTETTIWSMVKQVEKTDDVAVISIGKPIANTQIYILDSYLNPVPIGVGGELHIGGDGLARGYLNRPELTAEKFIESPFSANQKIYKTGDLARYLPDGNIEYLGRIDHQVKIRGFRIELGEIEAVINDYLQINQSVVIAKADKLGNQNLVAYLLVKNDFELQELRSYLKSKLPDYMIPNAFVVLESFPLTPNGKVDRKALPEPELNRENLQSSYQAPRTASEVILCEIFSELLNINPVGVHDNFFDLGGHSLLAVRLMALIQDRFKVNLPLAILFQSPTVEQLALLVNENNVKIANHTLIPMQTQGNKPPLFFIPGAGGNVIYLHSLAQALGTERPFYGLQPKGLNGEEELDNSVEAMANTYIQAMKKLQPQGPYFIAGHSFGGYVAYEVGRQLQAQSDKIGYILEVDTLAPKEKKYSQEKNMQEWQWLAMMLQQGEGLYGQKIGVIPEDLEKITDDDELYNYALKLLINAGILPPGSLVKQLRGIVTVYKANNDTKYVVNEQNCEKLPIVLFRSQGGFGEELDVMKEDWFNLEDWGWSDYANKSVNVEWIPGDHHTMMAIPHVEILAEKMRNYLG
ncbi:amino acid adenylation domain-containing protein [Anabaena sp. FACHB-1237]|uniref:amino acid adenylation domain-containing protein n=1 Tax=Anabaena sp. FACHB-1237 TaxID=2692769 RepID=UPI0016816258|nr:non-ribosomal peptide synthetase [Anabaena sp. FACHB-1237]MBD2137716.1 amino acid adenylation domain-containing protein [Anabaena sp. FACHB-1237]